MADHKSAQKQARMAIRRNKRNTSAKNAIRTIEKKLRTAIGEKKVDDAQALLKAFSSKIDKAAQKQILHAKTSARKISRLAKQLSALK